MPTGGGDTLICELSQTDFCTLYFWMWLSDILQICIWTKRAKSHQKDQAASLPISFPIVP